VFLAIDIALKHLLDATSLRKSLSALPVEFRLKAALVACGVKTAGSQKSCLQANW